MSSLVTLESSTRFPFHAAEEKPKLASVNIPWYNAPNNMSPSIEFSDGTRVSVCSDINTELVRERAEGYYHRDIAVKSDPAGAAQLRANAGKQITGIKADCYGAVNGSVDYQEGLEAGVNIVLGKITFAT